MSFPPIPFANASLDALESFTGGPSSAESGDIVGGTVDFGPVNIGGIGEGLTVPKNPLALAILGVAIVGILFVLNR